MRRSELLRLYKVDVRGGPNFAPANYGRGYNAALLDVAEAHGLSRERLEADWRKIDEAAYERSERIIARVDAEERVRERGET